MQNLSVLDKAELKTDPYPHVVIRDCLPWDYYHKLLEVRPFYGTVLAGREPGNNKRIDLSASALLGWAGLDPIWREFIKFHTSQDFWAQVCRVFGLDRAQERAGVRFRDKCDVQMDCQIGMNTPVLERSRVRGPHVDNPKEIFGGLLYMGQPQGGGDLVIYEPVEPLLFHGKAEIYDYRVRPVATVPYEHNTFVGFLNLPHSVHGVTPRPVTSQPRWLVNIIAEQEKPQFELPREREDVGRSNSILHRV